jgi:hypothetical protein
VVGNGVKIDENIELLLVVTTGEIKELDVVAGDCSVFDMELKRLESPAPAAVIMDGPVGAFWEAEDAGLGSFFNFFGDE